jgi:hypothetical protein
MTARAVPDQVQFSGRELRVPFRRVVEPEPQQHPSESQAARDDKRRLPSKPPLQPRHEWKGDDVADGDAAVEDAHREGTLADREPLGDDLCRTGPVARFTQTEDHAKRAQIGQSARKRVGGRRDRPHEDRQREAPLHPHMVVELPRQTLTGRIRDQKPGGDAAELSVGELQLTHDHGPENGHREPIDEIDERREKNEADDPPAQAADNRHARR